MIVRCAGEGCNEGLEMYAEEELSKNFKYICPRHRLVDPNEALKFQEYAFDPELKARKNKSHLLDLLSVVDGEKISLGQGFQIHNVRREEREMPQWVRSNEGVQKILLTAFPKLKTNSLQRKRAGRWAQVIQLHFKQGWTYREVADELNEKPRSIEMVIRSIVWTSKGMRANGSGPRTPVVT